MEERAVPARRRLITLASLALTLMLPTTVLAAGPIRQPLDAPDIQVEGVCPFPFLLHASRNSQTISIFPSGRLFVRGGFATVVTNLDTGQSLDLPSTSGPLTFTTNSDGTTTVKATGINTLFFFPGDLGPGRPGALLLLTGLTIEVVDATGAHVLSFEHHGSSTNLCDVLA
jgi:hypothetical protein